MSRHSKQRYTRKIKYKHESHPMKNSKNNWFTYIELTIVMLVLAILWTISVISYTNHKPSARDITRIQQITTLKNELEKYSISKKLPLPDNFIEVQSSWSLIWYQWFASWTVLNSLKMYWNWKTPLDNEYYTYYLSEWKNKFQLLTYLEKEDYLEVYNTNSNLLAPSANATDYTNKYMKVVWANLWLLTESWSNTPIQKIESIISVWKLDIVNTNSWYTAHISNTETINGTWNTLISSLPNANCKRIKQVLKSDQNKIYKINPTWLSEISVYCDMTTDWWWWTLIWVTESWNNPPSNFLDANIWTTPTNLNPWYNYSIDASILDFTEISMWINGDTQKYFGFYLPDWFIKERLFEEAVWGTETCTEHSSYYTYDSWSSKYWQQYYVYKESLITSRAGSNGKWWIDLSWSIWCTMNANYWLGLYRDKDPQNCAAWACLNPWFAWSLIDSTQRTSVISEVNTSKFPPVWTASVWIMVR